MLEVVLMFKSVADGWKAYFGCFGRIIKENNMKEDFKISIGTKKSKETWNKIFKPGFLVNHGWKFHELSGMRVCPYLITVETKYGELVVHDGDSITYLGNNLWDVRKG